VNARTASLPFKSLVVLVFGATLAFGLGGCGGSNSSSGAAATDAPSAAASADASAAPADASAAPDAAGGAAGGGGESRAAGRRMMAKALASVGLSDEQKATIRGIMTDARKQNEGADPETRRANYRAAYQKALAVMTPDQLARFKAKLAELRKERESGAQSSS